jgi:hypothetical protein
MSFPVVNWNVDEQKSYISDDAVNYIDCNIFVTLNEILKWNSPIDEVKRHYLQKIPLMSLTDIRHGHYQTIRAIML